MYSTYHNLFLFTLLIVTAFAVMLVSSMKSGRTSKGSKGNFAVGALWLIVLYSSINRSAWGLVLPNFYSLACIEIAQIGVLACYPQQILEILGNLIPSFIRNFFTRSHLFGAD